MINSFMSFSKNNYIHSFIHSFILQLLSILNIYQIKSLFAGTFWPIRVSFKSENYDFVICISM